MRRVTVVTAAALLAGCGGGRPDARGLERGETLLSVGGTGRAETRPDQAIFTAGLENIGADAGEASARAGAAVARIVAALKTQGVAERDIQTSALSIQRIGYGRDRGRFQATNTVTVKVRVVDKAGAAIAAATGAGANILSGPSLGIADPEAAALGAHAAAYRAARAKADAYARAAGLRIVRVVRIADGDDAGSMPMQAEAMDAIAPPPPIVAAPAPVMAGTNSQTVSVRVDFALAP